MFKCITRKIRIKKSCYDNLEKTEEKIGKAMRIYTASIFGDYIDYGDIKYSIDIDKSILTIIAPSKTIANEIKLSLAGLARTLTGEGLIIKTIIVQ